jgi:hypothetical protein
MIETITDLVEWLSDRWQLISATALGWILGWISRHLSAIRQRELALAAAATAAAESDRAARLKTEAEIAEITARIEAHRLSAQAADRQALEWKQQLQKSLSK